MDGQDIDYHNILKNFMENFTSKISKMLFVFIYPTHQQEI